MSESGNRLVLVTGPSGAGRTTAINALEDIGFETISNMPLSLITRLLEGPPMQRPLALGIDTRNRDFSVGSARELIGALRARDDVATEVVFVDCREDVLLRRYSETRRRHPLAEGSMPQEGIARERELLGDFAVLADIHIDTSNLSPHDLRAEMRKWFGAGQAGGPSVTLLSFSYKRGLPQGADLVFDCRFLSNPHWDVSLRPLDGRDPKVLAHIENDARFAPFLAAVSDLLNLVVPASAEEGKSHLTIAFGCSGGRHRSVAVTEKMANGLAVAGVRVSTVHRELADPSSTGPLELSE